MGFNDFWIQNENGKERLRDTKHGVRKDQVDKKFHNLFDAYDVNQDGTLESSELDATFSWLKIFAKGDSVLDASENLQAKSIFAQDYNIENADFQGFVKELSKASEKIINSQETPTADGGKEIKTTYSDGTVETIAYYPDGDFKFKKTDKIITKTHYELEINGQKKEVTEQQYKEALKRIESMSNSQPRPLGDSVAPIRFNNQNIKATSHTTQEPQTELALSERGAYDAGVRDFVLSHYIETHQEVQDALDSMGILDNTGALINAGAGELWNVIKNKWNGTDEEYQNFYELVNKFEPRYNRSLIQRSSLDAMRNHPEMYFRDFETDFNKNTGHQFDLEKTLSFQQTTERYQQATIIGSRLQILKKAMSEIRMYESEQAALTYALAQNEGLNPASHIVKANELLLQYFNDDQDAVDMFLDGTILSPETTIKAISDLASETEKQLKATLGESETEHEYYDADGSYHKTKIKSEGITYDQLKEQYQAEYKELYGVDFVPDELMDKVMSAKATGGLVKIAAITVVSILITKSPVMTEIMGASAGSLEATGTAANFVRGLVAKYGQNVVQQGIKFAMTTGTLTTDVALTLLNQVTDERNGVQWNEVGESTKSAAKYIYFGAYVGAPMAQAVARGMSKIGATARLFEGGAKTAQGAITTTTISGDKLVQNLMKGSLLSKGASLGTEITAFAALDLATEDINLADAFSSSASMQVELKIMSRVLEYMLGGRTHTAMEKAKMDAAIERSGVKDWTVKEIKSPSGTKYTVESKGISLGTFNDANALATAMVERVSMSYSAATNSQTKGAGEHTTTVDLTNLDAVKTAKPKDLLKPTNASTVKNPGITFTPNPNGEPAKAYRLIWCDTVEETIAKNNERGIPLELYKDPKTGEYKLGIKHSWDDGYFGVDRESAIVNNDYTAEKPSDWAVVAEDEGAQIFSKTYLNKETGKTASLADIEPGQGMVIIKNPEATVGASAFESVKALTSLEENMGEVDFTRTDVDGHPYGRFEELVKDINKGKIQANPKDPNSVKFIELVKSGKIEEARALLVEATKAKEAIAKSEPISPATAALKVPKMALDSPEFQAVTNELKGLYEKRSDNLSKAEKDRVTELEYIIQAQGILVARSHIIQQSKISMLAKAQPRDAFLPDFSNEAQLTEMGFTKDADGKWYHSNKDWYPHALSDKDVVYVFKRDANGKPIDTGFGPNHELATMYVRTEDFDNNNMKFVQASEMKPGQIISVKKCASGTFCILPVGTKLFTSEGIVEVKPDEIVNIKEGQNSVHVSKMSDIPDMYKADPLNPASKKLFDKISEYKEKEATLTEQEKIEAQYQIAETFGSVDRGQQLIDILGTGEQRPVTLREKFDVAARISKAIDEKYLSRIDCSNFDKGLEQAGKVMDEILADNTLNDAQKQAAIMGVMTHMVTTTNLHQHGKGSTPKDVTLALAREKGLPESTIADIEAAYAQADKGYPVLSEFNKAYDVIGQVIRTPEDYKASINGIIRESMKRGQLVCEIRCACDSLRDAATGKSLTPREGTLAIMKAIEEVKAEIRAEGLEPPKTSFVFLTFRGKGWDGSLPMSVTQAKEVVRVAEENPDMKFGYDVAGPEDTGWGPKAFKEAMDIINQYNEDVKAGRKKGNTIGVTMHAGETPTYEGGEGYKSVLDAIEMGAVRIGHGIQLAKYLKEMETKNPEEFNRVLNMVKEKGITIEICGVCNIQSIPINSEGMEQHAIQTFLDYNIPVTICTDNDAICGTNISKEYTQFLLTGHSNFMDWNAIKQSVRDGVEASFIPDADKAEVRSELESRIAKVQKLFDEKTGGRVLDASNTASSKDQLDQPVRIGVIDLFGKKRGIAFSNTKDFSHGELVAGAIKSQLKGQNIEVVPIELRATDPEGKRDRMVTTSYSMGSDSYGSKTNLYFNKKSFLKELKKINALPKEQKFQYLNVSNIIEVPYSLDGVEITPKDLADPVIREKIRKSLPEQIQHIIEEIEIMIEDGTEVYISAGNKRTTFNALSLAKGAHSIGGLDPKTGEPLTYFTNNALVEEFVPIPLSFTSSESHEEVSKDLSVKAIDMTGIIDQTHEFAKLTKRELSQKVATKKDYAELKQYIDKLLAEGKRKIDINFFQYSLAFNLPEKFRYKIYDIEKFTAMFEGHIEQEVIDYIRPMGTHCDIRYKQFFDMDAKQGHHIIPPSKTTLIRNTISGTSFAPGQIIARDIKAKKNNK